VLIYAEARYFTGSQVELMTLKKHHDAIQISSAQRFRFQRVDTQNQRQMSKVSDKNHCNPEWNPCEVFVLCVSSEMLQLGHDSEQMIKMSIWQKNDDGSSHELGFHMITVRDLYKNYYSIPTTEIEFPVMSEKHSGSEAAVSPSQTLKCTFGVSKHCRLVANLKFDGDWPEHLEVLNLKKNVELKESKLKIHNLQSGTSLCF
jgi:hypothetical protein